jgi:hypothetical protein
VRGRGIGLRRRKNVDFHAFVRVVLGGVRVLA